jgi:hypothetical protein
MQIQALARSSPQQAISSMQADLLLQLTALLIKLDHLAQESMHMSEDQKEHYYTGVTHGLDIARADLAIIVVQTLLAQTADF